MEHQGGSVFTFTPAAAAASHAFNSSIDSNEVFVQAGWNTPFRRGEADSGVYSFSPFAADVAAKTSDAEDIRQRMSRSREDFGRAVQARAEYARKLRELASPDDDAPSADLPATASTSVDKSSSTAASVAAAAMAAATGVGGGIPQSYEEIYSISVRNRQRHKDKKRGRDGPGDVAPSAIDVPLAGLSDAYFSAEGQAPDCDLKSTLDFARQVGWLQNAEHSRAVEEAHLRDEAQQAQLLSGGADEDQSGAALRRSADRSVSSSGSSLRPQQQQQQQIRPTDKPAAPKQFDYSKVSQGANIGAMHSRGGADPKDAAGKAKKLSNKQQMQQQPFRVRQEIVNPYLFNSGMDDK